MAKEILPAKIEATVTEGATPRIEARPIATRATTDHQLLDTWVAELGSETTRKNFRTTVAQFLGALPITLRDAKLEDVRDALEVITAGRADSTAKQYMLRVRGEHTNGAQEHSEYGRVHATVRRTVQGLLE